MCNNHTVGAACTADLPHTLGDPEHLGKANEAAGYLHKVLGRHGDAGGHRRHAGDYLAGGKPRGHFTRREALSGDSSTRGQEVDGHSRPREVGIRAADSLDEPPVARC